MPAVTSCGRYILNVLVSIDQLANTLAGGYPDETISSRSAKAWLTGKRWGCVMCRCLDFLDKDHCRRVIELNEGDSVSGSLDAIAGIFSWGDLKGWIRGLVLAAIALAAFALVLVLS
ncbi:hypothetical protein SAMN05216548_11420 [Faunimonas pinastri]|uniref:Uncharacterized protein n=1 Tax=Faunimonas pinastri TaxID=1855383 RepID=A0A1H9MT91_9HYPH|nr:hypothetical protein [Faunimonas pinastri]SER26353.1 hypothetical protein SAMN05216548_11420 [Faunimonas pinastri]